MSLTPLLKHKLQIHITTLPFYKIRTSLASKIYHKLKGHKFDCCIAKAIIPTPSTINPIVNPVSVLECLTRFSVFLYPKTIDKFSALCSVAFITFFFTYSSKTLSKIAVAFFLCLYLTPFLTP